MTTGAGAADELSVASDPPGSSIPRSGVVAGAGVLAGEPLRRHVEPLENRDRGTRVA